MKWMDEWMDGWRRSISFDRSLRTTRTVIESFIDYFILIYKSTTSLALEVR